MTQSKLYRVVQFLIVMNRHTQLVMDVTQSLSSALYCAPYALASLHTNNAG